MDKKRGKGKNILASTLLHLIVVFSFLVALQNSLALLHAQNAGHSGVAPCCLKIPLLAVSIFAGWIRKNEALLPGALWKCCYTQTSVFKNLPEERR